MKIYQRYLLRETVAAILLVLVAFLALFGFFDLIAELKDVGHGGYQLHHAIAYVLLCLPGRVYELMPVAVLIGTLYALSTLARHSEITVLRASGLSTQGLLGSLFLVAALAAVTTFVIGEFVAPPAERAANQQRMKAMGNVVAQEFRTGLWVKDERTFVNVRVVLPDARLRGVRIYEFDDAARLRSVSDAEEGEFAAPDGWRLTGVVRTVLDGERARVEKVPEIRWQSALNPDILSVLMVVPERMSLAHLSTYIHHLSENHQKTRRYEIALWKKMIYPLAAFVMVALALPFGYAHDRVGSVSLKIFSGVMIGIFFHMLNGLFSSLGTINNWPPLLSAVAPSALFLLAAVAMIAWVERR
ncbi:LPS export ABC transporter permease LptG [Rhodocyclus tenuis]|uniref:LPS export ABC transporter permease LptG n=1 Tax=Rhodocyclus gracilis TaxID=2929842 RepID=UPI001298B4A0|nr:LPS export ABC transporter permease LptG [Rhodocyclus gracilis]MRD73172.1 LPS export ABC transporter permease LptG [Rhodocyclus gracilis]